MGREASVTLGFAFLTLWTRSNAAFLRRSMLPSMRDARLARRSAYQSTLAAPPTAA